MSDRRTADLEVLVDALTAERDALRAENERLAAENAHLRETIERTPAMFTGFYRPHAESRTRLMLAGDAAARAMAPTIARGGVIWGEAMRTATRLCEEYERLRAEVKGGDDD